MELSREENKNTLEPIDWIKKYFNIDSFSKVLKLLDIKGIKESKLISKPIHMPKKELEDRAIKVPKIKVVKNKKIKLLNIKKDGFPFLRSEKPF